jgi:hypothetical protein
VDDETAFKRVHIDIAILVKAQKTHIVAGPQRDGGAQFLLRIWFSLSRATIITVRNSGSFLTVKKAGQREYNSAGSLEAGRCHNYQTWLYKTETGAFGQADRAA